MKTFILDYRYVPKQGNDDDPLQQRAIHIVSMRGPMKSATVIADDYKKYGFYWTKDTPVEDIKQQLYWMLMSFIGDNNG